MKASDREIRGIDFVVAETSNWFVQLLLGLFCLGIWAVVWVALLYPFAVPLWAARSLQ
jgi:hypothetical protein